MAHTRASGTSAATARAMAPEPVPRSTTNGGPAALLTGDREQAAQLGEGHVDDRLRLGAGDQDPPVDEEVEAAETPASEHVLQRFAAGAAVDHRPGVGDEALRRHLVETSHQLGPVPARGLLADEPRLVPGQLRPGLGQHFTPGDPRHVGPTPSLGSAWPARRRSGPRPGRRAPPAAPG